MSNNKMRNSPSDEDKLDGLRGDYRDVLDFLEERVASNVKPLAPLEDREEYNIFWRIVDRLERQDYSLADVQDMISHDYTSEARQLGLRIENKGVANWDVWSSQARFTIMCFPSAKTWH